MSEKIKIRLKEHTLIMLVGITGSGKTTFAKEVLLPQLQKEVPSLNYKRNVKYVSSDDIRQEIIGEDCGRYDESMFEVSEQAFDMLSNRVKNFMSYPVNSEFIVVDTTGMSEEFRQEMLSLAKDNQYNTSIITFDYPTKTFYDISLLPPKAMGRQITKYKKDVLPKLKKRTYGNIFRVQSRDFSQYEVDVTNEKEYLSNIVVGSLNIVSDIHEELGMFKDLLIKTDYMEEDNLIKKEDELLVINGDWIDKKGEPEGIINFMYDNMDRMKVVLGNHESYIYDKLMTKGYELTERDDEIFPSFRKLVEGSDITLAKFMYIVEHSHTFLKRIGTGKEPTVFITHSPCEQKYIGKLDKDSKWYQVIKVFEDRDNKEEELSFLKDYRFNYPVYVFGHVPTQRPMVINKKVYGIDTGGVYGNTLTMLSIFGTRRLFTSVGVEDVDMKQLFPKKVIEDVNMKELSQEGKKRLKASIYNKVPYVAGTMSPSNSNIGENDIESLQLGLEYYKRKGVKEVILQPKYMGSRCQIYLEQDIDKCYSISRNGFKIRNKYKGDTLEDDLKEVYQLLIKKHKKHMDDNKIKYMFLDGELLPWSLLGKLLIEKEFSSISKGLETEISILKETGFDEEYLNVFSENELEKFKENKGKYNKKEIQELYDTKELRRLKALEYNENSILTTDKLERYLEIYNKQLKLYGKETDVCYKGFNILKQGYFDGTESKFSTNNEEIYQMVNGENYVVLNLEDGDYLGKAMTYFDTLTIDFGFEGTVIKPIEEPSENSTYVPYLKVRNKEYLTLVYGWDYTEPSKLEKLVQKKNTYKKLELSLAEYRIGEDLLKIPYSELTEDNEEYKQLLSNMIFEVEKEQDLDPRL